MGGPKKPKRWRSIRWQEESDLLRQILLHCELDEAIKWGKPCYTHEGKNIAIIQEMKHFLALMFFKGSLLNDPEGVLLKPGENSNVARRFEFTTAQAIVEAKPILERYVREAIEIEKAGLTVTRRAEPVLPDELLARFERDPAFKTAFGALTLGRQRGYGLYFSAPKGAEARERRIDKYTPRILEGKGLHDR